MNISCAICAELFVNSDADKINVTHCGHVFHTKCLSTWLERAKTCPECRHRTTWTNVIRIYYNVSSDQSMVGTSGGDSDIAQLQSEVDNLKFKLLEQDAQAKKGKELVDQLNKENTDIKTKQRQTKQVILMLEQKNEQLKLLQDTHCGRMRDLERQLLEMDRLREQLDDANKKMNAMEAVQQVLRGTQKETETLLNEKRSPLELATLATALKRELNGLEVKYKQMRYSREDAAKDLRRCKDEKLKLEEKCAVLESKLFQLETQRKEKENESQSDTSLEEKQDLANRMNGNLADIKRRKITIESKTKSPHTFTVASSLAGLSPLLNPPKSSSTLPLRAMIGGSSKSSGLGPSTKEILSSNIQTSIFSNPRLIESNSKKSILRPSRLVINNSKQETAIPTKSVDLNSKDDVMYVAIPRSSSTLSRLDNAIKRVAKPIPK